LEKKLIWVELEKKSFKIFQFIFIGGFQREGEIFLAQHVPPFRTHKKKKKTENNVGED
jgi:hypothetical protein